MATVNYTNSPGLSTPLEIVSETDQGGLLTIITAFSLSLVLIIALPIRLYVRRTMSTYRLDDYAFLAASIFCFLQAAVVFYIVHIGFGKTTGLIDSSVIAPMEKSVYASDIFYVAALALSKLSTAFLFLRLTPDVGHTIAIWSTIGTSLAWTVASIFLVALRCHVSHPWTDTIFKSECPTLFARWQFIGALDIITEVALFAISVYLVWSIQMSRGSKYLVIGSFGCRIPIIALVGLRLYYLNKGLESDEPIYYGAVATSCMQIEIGYSIMASIVPCLKNFMAPYERPDGQASQYHASATGGGGANYKLSSRGSRSEADHGVSNVSFGRNAAADAYFLGGVAGAGNRAAGRLRPDLAVYEASVTHSRGDEAVRTSVDSENSRRMIIKKGVEWSVDYDTRTVSADSKENELSHATVHNMRSEQ